MSGGFNNLYLHQFQTVNSKGRSVENVFRTPGVIGATGYGRMRAQRPMSHSPATDRIGISNIAKTLHAQGIPKDFFA